MNTRFDRDTAAVPLGGGRFRVQIDPGWWVVRGPNGGYVAALLLRAMQDCIGDAQRAPRSLTVHYTLPPDAGPAEIETRIERSGRSLSTVTARMRQGERLLAVAIAAFSRPRDAPSFQEETMPRAPAPEECPVLGTRIPIHQRYEQRQAVGTPPFAGAASARVGGWIKLAEDDRPIDAPLVAAFADAWPPSMFARMRPEEAGTHGIPTVDLTVHFRASLPLPGMRADDYVLVAFHSSYADEGFVEEDGEIWSRDGRLLAQSRQLALLLQSPRAEGTRSRDRR
jgi:acyl-CoA thioesterase